MSDLALELDIKFAHFIIKSEKREEMYFKKRSRLYAFTTENIAGYIKKFNFKDTDVLTVTGSGDHALNAILMGARKVKCFDINRIANYFLELKIAAVKALNFEEFTNFFLRSQTRLNYDLYCKIENYLDGNAKMFWENIFDSFMPNEIYLLFDSRYMDIPKLSYINTYFNESDFNALKRLIVSCEISIVDSDVNNLPVKLEKERFDYIMLSNICSYINTIYRLENRAEIWMYRDLVEMLSKKLTTSGNLIFGYSYFRKDPKDERIFDYDEIRDRVFGDLKGYSKLLVPSYYLGNESDKVFYCSKN